VGKGGAHRAKGALTSRTLVQDLSHSFCEVLENGPRPLLGFRPSVSRGSITGSALPWLVSPVAAEASIRFRHFTLPGALNRVPWERARRFSNLTVYDADKDKVLFDLAGVVRQ
jgi:hypothetical protein